MTEQAKALGSLLGELSSDEAKRELVNSVRKVEPLTAS